MSRLFDYQYTPAGAEPHKRWFVIFCSHDWLDEAEFSDRQRNAIKADLLPSAIIFVVRQDRHAAISEQITNLKKSSSDWRIDLNDTAIVVVGFDERSQLGSVKNFGGLTIKFNKELFQDLMLKGLREIFILRDGLVRAGGSTHFVHPSGKHSRAFIRVANLLVAGAETTFIAMCLLRHIPTKINYIWIDTSSIASVVHAAMGLRKSITPTFEIPTISSFSSWDAVNKHFSFPTDPNSILLISASTSGNLARKLKEITDWRPEKIITLFSISRDPSELIELCNLGSDPTIDPPNAPPIASSFNDKYCEFCLAGSKPVHFVGDQFLADAIHYSPVKITALGLTNLKAFMEDYHGYGAFQMRSSDVSEIISNYYIDVHALLSSDKYLNLIKEACSRQLPGGKRLIVYDERDKGNERFARVLQEILKNIDGREATLLVQQKLRETTPDSEIGSVVVAAASIATGASLERVSRDLRAPYGDTPRSFVIGFSKHSRLPRVDRLRSNLAWSSSRFKHIVLELEKLCISRRCVSFCMAK